MKSDTEIKEWIDSKEFLNEQQLQKFIFGYNTGKKWNTFYRWWDYVLETKDKAGLKVYIDIKKNRGVIDYDLLIKLKNLIKLDPRIMGLSFRKGSLFIKEHYKLIISHNQLRYYINLIKQYELV